MSGRRFSVPVEEVIGVVKRRGIADVADVAEECDCSIFTARRKLDAATERGELIKDEYGGDGFKLPSAHYRYGDAA